MYTDTVGRVLKQDLWTERDMYDTAHYLMIPMQYAFASGDQGKMDAFHDSFSRFVTDVTGGDRHSFREKEEDVNLRQFLYFCSEYLRLSALCQQIENVPDELFPLLYDRLVCCFLELPGVWNTETNTKARVEQILLHKEYPYYYYSSLTDADMFPLAALCDLRVVSQLTGEGYTELLDQAALLAYRIFSDPIIITETKKNGFLFQVGVLQDYPDMQYAGNLEITSDIQPKLREDVVSDSSHASRLALWLISFQQAQAYQEQYDLFQLRREQLANQLVNYVIRYVDGRPLATTFTDGTFGVYRYSYNTEGIGQQGYSLSSMLLLGWWSLLDDGRITQIYEDILAQFPMSAGMDNPYYDYGTTREQNSFFDADTAFDNGMMECLVTLATKFGA